MTEYKGAASEAGRVLHLMKKREKQKEELERLKQKIEQVSKFYFVVRLQIHEISLLHKMPKR